jgi:D-glycerate 3-kinase
MTFGAPRVGCKCALLVSDKLYGNRPIRSVTKLTIRTCEFLAGAIAGQMEHTHRQSPCFTVGLCGAQGSGKFTLAHTLTTLLERLGMAAAVLSIDDLYLGKAERLDLARRIHPLFRTRGVPGTHDVNLGVGIIDRLARPGIVAMPKFDKSRDDRRRVEQWLRMPAPVDVLILEGWCVGAAPQEDLLLDTPPNDLEKNFDIDGVWRRYVNDALTGPYEKLFARIDWLMLLKAPTFDVVYRWRLQQEHQLRQRVAVEGGDLSHVMSDRQVEQFISHYERLTRHTLAEMPNRADVVLNLDAERRITRVDMRVADS